MFADVRALLCISFAAVLVLFVVVVVVVVVVVPVFGCLVFWVDCAMCDDLLLLRYPGAGAVGGRSKISSSGLLLQQLIGVGWATLTLLVGMHVFLYIFFPQGCC